MWFCDSHGSVTVQDSVRAVHFFVKVSEQQEQHKNRLSTGWEIPLEKNKDHFEVSDPT